MIFVSLLLFAGVYLFPRSRRVPPVRRGSPLLSERAALDNAGLVRAMRGGK